MTTLSFQIAGLLLNDWAVQDLLACNMKQTAVLKLSSNTRRPSAAGLQAKQTAGAYLLGPAGDPD